MPSDPQTADQLNRSIGRSGSVSFAESPLGGIVARLAAAGGRCKRTAARRARALRADISLADLER
jgi:hypothetical protein